MKNIIEFKNISKTFKSKNSEVHALKNISLSVQKGDIFGVIGFSGAGKSTLVRMINALEKPTSGSVIVNDENVLELRGENLRGFRKNIGMIFQHFNLLESRTVFQNIAIPLELEHWPKSKITARVNQLLKFGTYLQRKHPYRGIMVHIQLSYHLTRGFYPYHFEHRQ